MKDKNFLMKGSIVAILILVAIFLFWPASNHTSLGIRASENLPDASITFTQAEEVMTKNPQSIHWIKFFGDELAVLDRTDGGRVKVELGGSAAQELNDLAKANHIERSFVHTVRERANGPSEDQSQNLLGSPMTGMLVQILIFFVLPIGLLIYFQRKNGALGGGGQNAQADKYLESKAQKIEATDIKVTFEDVAGIDASKEELTELVDILKDPRDFVSLGGKIPRGVLMVGPPGTGKTLCAKAVAGESKRPFYSMSGSDFVEMFVGVGASRVGKMFEEARKNAPCIIFIDEIDAIGRHRGAGMGGGHDEREQTLNKILVEMDGFDPNAGIIVIAATNRPDILDPALLRPGRFDRQITVSHPDVKGREAILKVHLRNVKTTGDVEVHRIAKVTPGFSGADLMGLVQQGVAVAFRRSLPGKRRELIEQLIASGKTEEKAFEEALKQLPAVVSHADLIEGKFRQQMGIHLKGMVMSDINLLNTNVHELGHAIQAEHDFRMGRGGDPVNHISIMVRSKTLGVTETLPADGDHLNYTKEQCESMIRRACGGRIAQMKILGTCDTGAENDFKNAYEMAKNMVSKWGMSKLGFMSVGSNSDPFLGRQMAMGGNDISQATLKEIEDEAKAIIGHFYVEAEEVFARYTGVMGHMVDVLWEEEALDRPQWVELFDEATKAIEAGKTILPQHEEIQPLLAKTVWKK